jgi:hypothetical protein
LLELNSLTSFDNKDDVNKKDLSERDICSKFIGPAVKRAGWDGMMQIREEVIFTKGRIIVRGKLVTRGKAKRADYILYYKPNDCPSLFRSVVQRLTTTILAPSRVVWQSSPAQSSLPSISDNGTGYLV